MGPNLHQPLYAHTPAIVCTYTCLCYALGTVVLRLFMSVDVCLNIMLSKWPCVQPTQQTTVVHKQPIYMCISTYIPYWHWASLSLPSLSPSPFLSFSLYQPQKSGNVSFLYIKRNGLFFVVSTKFNVSTLMFIELLIRCSSHIHCMCI